MKTRFLIILCFLCSCSKKNSLPSSSTNATIQFVYPDGRSYSFVDFSVKGGSQGYVIDGGTQASNAPIDYITDIPAFYTIPEYYLYNFKGYSNSSYYNLSFGASPIDNSKEYINNSLSLSLKDSFYEASNAQIAISAPSFSQDPCSGSFVLTFELDSVTTNNRKIAYPAPGTMTIKGTFSNVGLFN